MVTKKTDKKPYRVVQNEGKITWKVQELWEGGIERGPYSSKEGAIKIEEKIAQDSGFFDDLVQQDTTEEVKSQSSSFERDNRGTWYCKEACSLEISNRLLTFTEGMTFTKGTPYMAVDVAQWLDENYK